MARRPALIHGDLPRLLRQKSQKVTPARLALLRLLAATKKPLSAEAIQRRLGQVAVNQATIYRTLTTLQRAGLVRQVDFQRSRGYWELASLGEHHHAVCRHCGRVEDIKDCCTATMEESALQQSGFAAITHHSLEFFGLCKNCSNQTRAPSV